VGIAGNVFINFQPICNGIKMVVEPFCFLFIYFEYPFLRCTIGLKASQQKWKKIEKLNIEL